MYILFGLLIGTAAGFFFPWSISAVYSKYAAVALLAAFDSVFGGVNSKLKHRFDINIFISGFFGNILLAVLLTYIGGRLGIDLYYAALIVFGVRLFQNFAEIRRELLTLWKNGDRI